MNIMLFSRIIAWSGVGNHISQLARELSKAGHNVIVVSSTNDRKIGQGNGNEKFFFLSPITLNPVNILKGIQKLYRIIIEEKIEVVHCHHRMAALYMQAYNLFYKVPVVYTLHLADVPSDFFHRKMTFFGDQAIGVSTEVCRFMIDKLGIPKNKVNLVLNGVDPEQLPPFFRGEESGQEKLRN